MMKVAESHPVSKDSSSYAQKDQKRGGKSFPEVHTRTFNIDGLGKSRHSGENRSPGYL
jgi:hypothetical protein